MLWTDILAIVLAALGCALLVHHGITHYLEGPECSAQKESVIWVGYFQLKDVEHWETWAVVCSANAVSLGLIGYPRFAGGLGAVAVCLGALSCRDGFNPHNIRNHETWVVACFTSAATLVLG